MLLLMLIKWRPAISLVFCLTLHPTDQLYSAFIIFILFFFFSFQHDSTRIPISKLIIHTDSQLLDSLDGSKAPKTRGSRFTPRLQLVTVTLNGRETRAKTRDLRSLRATPQRVDWRWTWDAFGDCYNNKMAYKMAAFPARDFTCFFSLFKYATNEFFFFVYLLTIFILFFSLLLL